MYNTISIAGFPELEYELVYKNEEFKLECFGLDLGLKMMIKFSHNLKKKNTKNTKKAKNSFCLWGRKWPNNGHEIA